MRLTASMVAGCLLCLTILSFGSPLLAQGLSLKIRKIMGTPARPSAMIEYRGTAGIYSADDERIGAFRVIEINSDRVVVFSVPDQVEKTFMVEGAAPSAPAGVSSSGSPANNSIMPPAGKGNFKIQGIIGKPGSFSVIMEKDSVQLMLSIGQTVENQFTIVDIQADKVVLSFLSDKTTGSFTVGNEVPFSSKP